MDIDISMNLHVKSVDMNGKFHIHGKPVCVRTMPAGEWTVCLQIV